MIIKSTTRKDSNFKQLIEYIHRDGTERGNDPYVNFTYTQNIQAEQGDNKAIIREFWQNDKHRKTRKNGVAQYHEILSFAPEDTEAIQKNPFILWDISMKYIGLRCPNALAVAKPHYEKEHYHIHVVFSGNEIGSDKTLRMSKKEFEGVKQQVREYQKEQYPELQFSYSKDRKQQSLTKEQSHKERQMEQRGASNHKTQLYDLMETAVGKGSRNDFDSLLHSEGASVYERNGKAVGVIFNNRKYRFKTLFKSNPQLLQSFEHLMTQPKNKQVDRLQQLQGIQEQSIQSKKEREL